MDARTGGDIFMYYQYADGSLRYISMSPDGVWQGSRTLPVDDAKLGTPLTATYYVKNGLTAWWLFYVDKSNNIRNIWSLSHPTEWLKGIVGGKQYAVPAQSSIAFTVARGIRYDAAKKGIGGGFSLFASGTDGHMREYLYSDDDESWTDGSTFTSTNGYGGAWHLGPPSHATVMANASMCGNTALFYQTARGRIQASNFSTVTDPDLMRWDTTYDISDGPAMKNSALSCWFVPGDVSSGSTMYHVFYQAENGDIMEARRYWEAVDGTAPGAWHYQKVPIT
ncbi:hypothetical protein FQN52_002578 [Onygenales sp. PD_12]|nr:hypothetical protein FQN52_002578 [Onygenales sp. PD_12]